MTEETQGKNTHHARRVRATREDFLDANGNLDLNRVPKRGLMVMFWAQEERSFLDNLQLFAVPQNMLEELAGHQDIIFYRFRKMEIYSSPRRSSPTFGDELSWHKSPSARARLLGSLRESGLSEECVRTVAKFHHDHLIPAMKKFAEVRAESLIAHNDTLPLAISPQPSRGRD